MELIRKIQFEVDVSCGIGGGQPSCTMNVVRPQLSRTALAALRCTASARCFSAEALRREPSRPHQSGSLPHQQSRYENYDKTSSTYDNVRSPIGLPDFESVLSTVASRRGLASPRDLTCLDGGCGTGNYTHSLSKVVGSITGVEPNAGMRAKARAKMADAGVGNVEVLDGSLDRLPVRDASVDVVWITQVLHHLYESSTTPRYGAQWVVPHSSTCYCRLCPALELAHRSMSMPLSSASSQPCGRV